MNKLLLPLIAVALLASACIFCRATFPPNIPVPEVSGGDVERGRYLVEHGTACFACHSERDWRYYAAPHKPETKGAAGEVFREGKVVVGTPNISPTALKDWSDGEVVRAIAHGVSKDGGALFPIMPYAHYNRAAKSDLAAIVAYLRTLPPQAKVEVPARELPGPLPLLVKAMVKEAEPREAPPNPNDADYGEYVTELASCVSCHTPMKGGRPIEGMEFAGGREFPLPTGGTIRSSNLTPHQSGLKNYTKDAFIARFRAMLPENIRSQELPAGSMNTVMPWTEYNGMTDEDLGAIYDFLKSREPVENKVIRYDPPEG
jgi:mono/diheme cytochrome c family protein